jgi:Fe-S cluster assembly protein SufD
MTQTTDTISGYASAFEGLEASLNGDAAGALHARRRDAMSRLRREGLPTARYEAWQNTNPAPLTRSPFVPAPAVDPAAELPSGAIEGLTGPRLVFVDGRFDASRSRADDLPEGLQVLPLSQAGDERVGWLGEHGGFATLNMAFLVDAAVIEVADEAQIEPVVEIVHLSSGHPGLTTPRTLVRAGKGSHLRLVETFLGVGSGEGSLCSAVADVDVGEGARVEHVRLHRHVDAASHVGTLHVTEAPASNYTAHTFCLGGRLLREDVHTILGGEEIESTLNGLSLALADEHVDHYTTIEHAAPNCASHELYKGVLGGKAHTVFRGKIHVHQVAQKTDAYQSNQNLLLSPDAEIDSKPQLEIYADDVKCSHGSTTGQLDEDALFYLRARGIGRREATRVLTRAFAGELVDRICDEPLRQHVEQLVGARLDAVLADDGSSS